MVQFHFATPIYKKHPKGQLLQNKVLNTFKKKIELQRYQDCKENSTLNKYLKSSLNKYCTCCYSQARTKNHQTDFQSKS